MFNFDKRNRRRKLNADYELYQLNQKEKELLETIEYLQDPAVIGRYQGLLNQIQYAKFRVMQLDQELRK